MAMKQWTLIAGLMLAGGLAWYLLDSRPMSGAPGAGEMASPSTGEAELGMWGVNLGGIDTSTEPGDDFFRYVNGTWLEEAEIPADRTSTGSFLDLSIRSEERVQAILSDLEIKENLSGVERKVRDLYRSFVDTERLEEIGLAPATDDLQTIAEIETHEDAARVMASVSMGTESIFGIGIGIDDKNPDAYAAFVTQSGLGLPDRDYYLLDEPNIIAAREAYLVYIAKMLELVGVAGAQEKAAEIYALEAQIADIHWPRADRRDADRIYNPMTVSALSEYAPGFPWPLYLEDLSITTVNDAGERIVVASENTAFPPLAELFAATSVAIWRDYLTFHYLDSHAPYLSNAFDEAYFEFRGRTLAGQDQQLERAKRGVQFLNRTIGEGVGQIYVARHFPPSAKAEAEALVDNLLAVYRDRIQTLDWMGEETRAQALEKAQAFTVKIGYPDDWRDYSELEVIEDDLFGNRARGAAFEWNYDVSRLDEPVDRSEWHMSPQTVNAYYNPSLNEIVFPAAILQAPFFDPYADDAVNYGGIGAVIGHEISHGFDDQGSKYDARGILENWWTESDRVNFEGRAARLVDQFNAYSPLEGMFVNGQLTLGENIADTAGITIAHSAYALSLGGEPAPVLDGFDGDQRVFLGYAQVWRYKAQEATMRRRILSDPHSPPEFRVNGAIRNVDGWYEAFGVAPDRALYLPPEERVQLW
jgi:predicted metalloendopeptidase